MKIFFERKKDRRLANQHELLQKEFKRHPQRANLIRKRLDELADAENLGVMRTLPQAYCHELKGNRAGQLAVRLDGRFRMIFVVANDPVPRKSDGGLDWGRVTAIRVIRLAEDYHGG